MKRWLLRIGGMLGVLGAVGLLVMVLGLVSMAASGGHFSVTESFLQFAKRRSVARHAPSQVPGQAAPWLVAKGATHYELACRSCHGSPGEKFPRVAQVMLPQPPQLATPKTQWTPGELFYIVKHGLKFTGMPAFASQRRDDEVRSVVAFLEALPGLNAEQYAKLAVGSEPKSGEVIAACAQCHGADGLGRGSPAFPKLAGQHKESLVAALEAYASGARYSGIMQPIAAALNRTQLEAAGEHFAKLADGPRESADAEAIARGRAIAVNGIPARKVPSCADCHGPKPHALNGHYPRLDGQWEEYLVLQLELFGAGNRGGSVYFPLMERAVHTLTVDEARDVSVFYARDGR